ncbi:hypothetical protein H0E82_13885 [Luteimonas sp. SJ-16]|uniref:FimV N-terminal domain-containing protein n=2 Tax=Luteimonas deserti TaxID=2752306 RepID=A0A7Z0QTM0_9GAMM|nr:hypothetical protein [Luteimonas deserti]
MARIVPRLLLAGALLALAGPVLALGLGRIEVRSQQGQPLLAEIPIVSSDPDELRELQARLASPETFARIGLEPPQGLVSNLQFSVALDPRGRPVIRVTSSAPVEQESLTFLVEVDWGQGRLVREYSALVAVPDTLAAPAQPSIQAPVAAPPATIVRAPETAPAAPPGEARPDDAPPTPDAVAAQPPAPSAPRPAPAQPVATPGELPPVQAGQTLSGIAAPIAAEAGISVNQAMLLLLRTNPDAFIGGNLNLVRQGAVLRVPPRDQWNELSAAEANAVVREQVGQWRDMRRPAPQPATPTAETSGADATAAAGPAPRTAAARLEITPPASDSQPAGSQSGIAAGAGGDMLRQELQQANESLAARTAEIEELKARLADLEALQQQQQQLIALKDADLAAAQQRLETSNQQQAASGAFPWIWLGLALLVVAALAFVLGRRVRIPASAPQRRFDSAALAAGMPRTASPVTAAPAETPAFAAPPPPVAAVPEPAPAVAAPASAVRPTWHAGTGAATRVSPVPVQVALAQTDAPAAPAGGRVDDGAAVARARDEDAATTAALETPELPAGVERLELARAYLDLGDTATARTLLAEVAAGDDTAARDEAAQLLRTLG